MQTKDSAFMHILSAVKIDDQLPGKWAKCLFNQDMFTHILPPSLFWGVRIQLVLTPH